MIELSAQVQVFSYLGIAVLVIWAPPSLQTNETLSGQQLQGALYRTDLYAKVCGDL